MTEISRDFQILEFLTFVLSDSAMKELIKFCAKQRLDDGESQGGIAIRIVRSFEPESLLDNLKGCLG